MLAGKDSSFRHIESCRDICDQSTSFVWFEKGPISIANFFIGLGEVEFPNWLVFTMHLKASEDELLISFGHSDGISSGATLLNVLMVHIPLFAKLKVCQWSIRIIILAFIKPRPVSHYCLSLRHNGPETQKSQLHEPCLIFHECSSWHLLKEEQDHEA